MKISSEIVWGSWEVPCELLGVCAESKRSEIRGLETTAGVGSLVGSVDPVARRVTVVVSFAPPVLEVGIIGAGFMIFFHVIFPNAGESVISLLNEGDYWEGCIVLCDTPRS